MPITFTQPAPGQPIGPGWRVNVSSDFIGPLPEGSTWTLVIREQVSERVIHASSFAAFSNVFVETDAFAPLPFLQPSVRSGATVDFSVSLDTPAGTVDNGTTQVVWENVEGAVNWLINNPTSGTGGLTPIQALQVEETHQFTQQAFGVPGAQLIEGVAELLQHPILAFLRIGPGLGIVSGSGALLNPVPEQLLHYGLFWTFQVIPPELGVRTGLTPEWQQRMIQLQVIHTLGGLDVVTQVVDVNYDRVVFLFDTKLPTRIEYDILPGVTLQFHWVELSIGG